MTGVERGCELVVTVVSPEIHSDLSANFRKNFRNFYWKFITIANLPNNN